MAFGSWRATKRKLNRLEITRDASPFVVPVVAGLYAYMHLQPLPDYALPPMRRSRWTARLDRLPDSVKSTSQRAFEAVSVSRRQITVDVQLFDILDGLYQMCAIAGRAQSTAFEQGKFMKEVFGALALATMMPGIASALPIIQASGSAIGTISYFAQCDDFTLCGKTFAETQAINFQYELDNLAIGSSVHLVFSIGGGNAHDADYSVTIFRSGAETFYGTNYLFTQTDTENYVYNFHADTFTVVQTYPEPSPPGSSVPEPVTWAMMTIGFGAVGFALRRRQITKGPGAPATRIF